MASIADQTSRHTWGRWYPGAREVRPDAPFTNPLWRRRESEWVLHGGWPKIVAMDAVAVILGIAMFAILYVLITGIDRV